MQSVFFVAAAFVAFALYWGSVALYQWYFSPLREIPGPWLASLSPLWLTLQTIRLRLCYAVEGIIFVAYSRCNAQPSFHAECFQRYGPVVRVGPNTVFFRDGETMKEVYGNAYKATKGDFYKVFESCVPSYPTSNVRLKLTKSYGRYEWLPA